MRRRSNYKKTRKADVYGFSKLGFEEIKGARQWASKNPVPINETLHILNVSSLNDLMRNSLQIFLLEGSFDEIQEEFFATYWGLETENLLVKLARKGTGRWINREQQKPLAQS